MRISLTRQQFWLLLILAGYTLLAALYSVVTPIFEASDELWHYPMVRTMAAHRLALPVQNPAQPGPWRQEGSQPPLYYALGAALTFWIDTSDLDDVRQINPHADLGVIVPDGNLNMVMHDWEREGFPWRGTVLAVHLVRLLSVLLGLGTVALAYELGRALFPDRPAVALGAAALTAFNPMFLFISGAINNDNLSTLLASALLLLIVRLVQRRDTPPALREYVLLGLLAGAGMLAKFQIGFLLPLIALALALVARRFHDWHLLVIGGLISGGLTILIAGWWYWRNYDLYGDATGINIFLDIVGRRAVPADLRQLWTERRAFMMSYWGFFGGVNLPLPGTVYIAFNLIALAGLLGLFYGLGNWLRARGWRAVSEPGRLLARAFALIWPLIVLISLISWTRQTWASQGRLWFSAIAPLSLGLALGLAEWAHLPRLAPALRARLEPALLGSTALIFAAVAAVAPFAVIRPAYTLDRFAAWEPGTPELPMQRAACFAEPGADRPALCMAYQPLDGSLRPGDFLRFSPAFAAAGDLTRDWSIFVHLVSEDGIIEAQRDVYPGGGLIATSLLPADEAWHNLIAVPIPPGTYTPQVLDVYLGLYDGAQRMTASGDGADPATNRVHLGAIRLETPPGSVPNPVQVNFEDRLRLLGYEVTARSLDPGRKTVITLYWESLEAAPPDYVISVQIIDTATLTKAAQADAPPTPPVSAWRKGEIIADSRTLTVFPDAPPGRYRVMVRVYPPGDPAHPLRVLGGEGGQSEDFALLNWMQVR